MKPNSKVVALVCSLLGVAQVSEINVKMINRDVAIHVQSALTPEASDLIADLFSEVGRTKKTCNVGSESEQWKKTRLGAMTQDQQLLFELLYLHYGHRVELTETGITAHYSGMKKAA